MLNTLPTSTRRLCHQSATRSVLPRRVSSKPTSITARWIESNRRLFASLSGHREQVASAIESQPPVREPPSAHVQSVEWTKHLPLTCPGCGAHSQSVDPDAAGFYGSKRAAKATNRTRATQAEDDVFHNALKYAVLPEVPAMPATPEPAQQDERRTICDRCHYLLYQSRGTSILHPSMQSIQQIIQESPHKHNHIYHVLDAADFPMSLIPNLQHALKLPRLRTQNRRSKTATYVSGRVAEVSFIITRSDLLAPKKEQVDSLVPYLREVLRDALGRSGRNVRLGNVRCVSAHRGWWTRTVKEDIWSRGGAGWMVGKVNVGKSALYEVVFPKGRSQVDTDVNRMRNEEGRDLQSGVAALDKPRAESSKSADGHDQSGVSAYSPFGSIDAMIDEHIGLQQTELKLEDSKMVDEVEPVFDESEDGPLLPPAQRETAYPQMPLVSALPGTTASPIRIPFGNGKGELIDLPGIHRTSLDAYINPEHHKSLVMKSRVAPEQYTVKPGQSILIGGVIRITPRTDELIFLAYPFVPLKAHVTSHSKAVAIQTGVEEDGEPYNGNVECISTEPAKQTIKSAGIFQLQWNVTKRRTGSLTDKAAGKVKTAGLPFIVYSADILIESVGWVELTCQVRRGRRALTTDRGEDALGAQVDTPTPPEVEVFTPEGRFVTVRRPMNAWVLGGPKILAKHRRRLRPRQSISMARRKAGGAMGQIKPSMVEE